MILREVPAPSTLAGPKAGQDPLVHEMRVFCVLGLFHCLGRNLRVAYILGETMDISGPVGAEILGTTPETFRKRLSRARAAACLDQPCETLGAFHAFSPDAKASFDAFVASGSATPG